MSQEIENDILQKVRDEDLKSLMKLYLTNWPKYIHNYIFIENYFKLKEKNLQIKIEIFCPNGDWSDGTFVAIIAEQTYSLAFGTLDKTASRLKSALSLTKRIDWKKGPYIYTIHEEISEQSLNVLQNVGKIEYINTSICFWLPKEKAIDFKINLPAGFEILPLESHHGPTIFSHWNYKFPGANEYIMNLIKISDGFGVFEVSTGSLCSWILLNEYGVFGVLQTIEEYQGKKFATEIVKYLALHRARKGLDSISNAGLNNFLSQKIFVNVGFERVHNITWVQFKKED